MYLPDKLIPGDFENADFDTFFRVLGMAMAAREMKVEDIEAGVNKGYVKSFPEPD